MRLRREKVEAVEIAKDFVGARAQAYWKYVEHSRREIICEIGKIRLRSRRLMRNAG